MATGLTEVDKSLDVLGPRVLQEGGGSIKTDLLTVIDVEDNVVLDGVVDEVTNHLYECKEKMVDWSRFRKNSITTVTPKLKTRYDRSSRLFVGIYFTSKQTDTPTPSSVAP